MKDLNKQFQQIDELLQNAKKVLIASHERPDSDAVASELALHNFFIAQNIESLPYLPGLPPGNLNFLPRFFDIKTEIGSFGPDILFCLDYGDFKRLNLPEDIIKSDFSNVITIDHHVASDQKGGIKIIEPHFSSTSEIVYHWLKYKNIDINKEIATCLLTGIISDSGGFRHVSTSAGTLGIVSELLLTGVSLNKIVRQTMTFGEPLNFSKAWGSVLSRSRVDENTKLAYSSISFNDLNKLGVSLMDFDGITNLVSTASPINLGLFLVEYKENKIKGSLRSEPHGGRDVVKIAKALGGGGHPYAAGFEQEGTIDETLQKVLKLLE